MKITSSSALVSSALMLLAGVASADTLHVPRDYRTIQEAVTAARPGDIIDVSRGVYRENVRLTTPDLTLRGSRAVIDGAYAGSCLDVRADGVTVSGFAFVNGGSSGPLDGHAPGGGVNVEGRQAAIVDCEASACVSYGIRLLGSGSIANCLVTACHGPGLLVGTGAAAGDAIQVTGNVVRACATGIEAADGPFVIDRNSVGNNHGDGIRLAVAATAASTAASSETRFLRNTVMNNGGTGLAVQDELGVVGLIEECRLGGNALGLDLTGADVSVVGNEIGSNRGGGIFLKASGATLGRNTIRRNGLCGILVASLPGSDVGRNTLTANRIEANGGDGIHVLSGFNVLDANQLRDNEGDGLQIMAGAAANAVTGNAVRGSLHDGIDNWGSETILALNVSAGSMGADLAGLGDGRGSVAAGSGDNRPADASGLHATQELELATELR